MQKKLTTSLNQLLSLGVGLLIMIVLIRLLETFYICPAYHLPAGSMKYELAGLGYDLLFWLKIMSWILLPFLVFGLINPLLAKIFFMVTGVCLILGSLALSFYFGYAKLPLGADLFGYTYNEISKTIGAAGGFNMISTTSLIVFSALGIFLFIRLKLPEINQKILYLYAFLLLILLFAGSYGSASPASFKKEFDSFLATNKTGYFLKSVVRHYKEQAALDNTAVDMTRIDAKTNYDFVYVSKDFPFLHRDKSPDVLGSFFNKSATPPNFVFIIVESLGRAYTGKDAYLGSFTPFLDSLMQHSLYWENMLSTSGRTFSVMPSVFGSLPFGEHGFAEMGADMPAYQGLLGLLKNNHYSSAFYYGGDANFDNMAMFLKRQGVERIEDNKTFGPEFKKMPANGDGFSWGYGDKAIFSKYLKDLAARPAGPRADVILTLSMHSPFLVNEQEKYNKKFDDRLAQLTLPADKKEYNKQYKAQFATMLFFDDALRALIAAYSKRPDYKNTIFIITGDHRMPEIPISTQLDRFHVPLVIWSPMIKTPATFSSISTHFDITPSIIAFLKNNYHLNFPSTVAWIGHGLDVQAAFRNIHSYALMRNKSELMDFISGEDFLSGTMLYKVYKSLDIEPYENDNRQADLQKQFDLYKQINREACSKNKIWPDSLLNKK